MIQSYLNRLTRSELFAVMTCGFASVAGSTLLGYALLARRSIPAGRHRDERARVSLHRQDDFPQDRGSKSNEACATPRQPSRPRDRRTRGAHWRGKIAVIVGCLLIAFIALIALPRPGAA